MSGPSRCNPSRTRRAVSVRLGACWLVEVEDCRDDEDGTRQRGQCGTLVMADAAVPDVYDIDLARRVVRVHCLVRQYPSVERCLNCGWPFPCVSHCWGWAVLLAAGWNEAEIAALDTRSGPWSS